MHGGEHHHHEHEDLLATWEAVYQSKQQDTPVEVAEKPTADIWEKLMA